MAHELKIHIDDLNTNINYIRVSDYSVYDKRIEVTNRVLKIVVASSEDPFVTVPFPVSSNFTYNSKSLKISNSIEPLPDGLWEITYSVCPNEKVFTKVFYFRTTKLQLDLYSLIANMLISNDGTIGYDTVYDSLTECVIKLKALQSPLIDSFSANNAVRIYNEINKTVTDLNKNLK